MFHKKRLKRDWGYQDFGIPFNREEMGDVFHLNLTDSPVKLSDHVYFSGTIPRVTRYEKPYALGEVLVDGEWRPDMMEEEAALFIQTKDGIFIITACTHCGIGNVIEKAKSMFPGEKISGVLGGLHLFKPSPRLEGAINAFEENKIDDLYPCHCTSFRCRAEIDKRVPVHEVGVGMVKELETADA